MEETITNAINLLEAKRTQIDRAINELKGINKPKLNGKKRINKLKGERGKSREERSQILELLEKNRSGLQTLEIANKANIPYGAVLYHLRILESRKRITREGFKKKGGYLIRIV